MSRRTEASRRGSALVMSLVLAGVLAMLATAFIITVRIENKASVNTLRGAQAEAACRMGLAAAVYRIELSASVYSNLDDAAKWHGYFHSPAADAPNLCDGTWVAHYDAHDMKARRWTVAIATGTDPAAGLKRQKGFTSEYYVAVADLDGKLHANPYNIDNLLDAAGTEQMLLSLGISATAANTLATDNSVHRSLGELRAKLVPVVPSTEWNSAEQYFTVYQRVTDLSSGKAAITREQSRVNVNTARKEVLRAIVSRVPGFTPVLAQDVADKLAAKRPFPNRIAMEKALVELGNPAWSNLPAGYTPIDNRLDERQMNNLLNSLAGTSGAAESDLDQSGNPGLYSYDFSDNTSLNRDQTGDTDAVSPAATWGTEVKFTSDFYHVYILGRTLAPDGRVSAERRMHAIYDAPNRRILWQRWNFGAKANMSD